MAEISPQASLYVPVAIPATNLPSYVTCDLTSQWHVSGLLAAALESMTLSSRLKTRNGSQLDEMTSFLNVNGNQNIAKFRMSIDAESKTPADDGEGSGIPGTGAQPKDIRVPLSNGHAANDVEERLADFDIDFFPALDIEQITRSRSSKKTHVFGQVESYRGSEIPARTKIDGDEEILRRARLRAAGRPLVHE